MFLFAEGGHHEESPLIVQAINEALGKYALMFEKAVSEPAWDWLFRHIGVHTTAEKLFGPYDVEHAIPWYTIMFVIACLLTIAIIWIFKGKLSEDDPKPGQLTLEAAVLTIRDMVVNVIGEHGIGYFPVVATFAILILVSNLMGLFPLFMSPTAHISVTVALGLASFIYYNYVGISENGIVAHFGHLTGPKLPLILMVIITPLIFLIELFSNLIRPLTLGIRLFANMFADEQVAAIVSGLYPPVTQILVPIILLPLAIFVAVVQAFVFTLLSMIYISEVSHVPHDHAHEEEIHDKENGKTAMVEFA